MTNTNTPCPYWDRIWKGKEALNELHANHDQCRFPRLERWQRAEPDRANNQPCSCGNEDRWSCYWHYQRKYILGQGRTDALSKNRYHPEEEIDRKVKFLCNIYMKNVPKHEVMSFGSALAARAFELELEQKEITWYRLKAAALEEIMLRNNTVDAPKYLSMLSDFEMGIVRDDGWSDGPDNDYLARIIHNEGIVDKNDDCSEDTSWESLKDIMDYER